MLHTDIVLTVGIYIYMYSDTRTIDSPTVSTVSVCSIDTDGRP